MNKIFQSIICVILTYGIISSCQHDQSEKIILEIGVNLISLRDLDSIPQQNPNFIIPNVRHVGPSLFNKIKQTSAPVTEFSYHVKKGDAKYPIGDGTASEVLEIRDNNNTSIYVRLKYSSKDKIFDILGYY